MDKLITRHKQISSGILFAALWATGSVAFKFGIKSADPLILAVLRFTGTGLLFGPYLLIRRKCRFWPNATEWKPILLYGLLNTTLTLGSFAAAQRYASAGISMLFIAITPLMIALLSTLLLKRKLTKAEVVGMFVAFSGLMIASLFDLSNAYIKPLGMVLLLIYVIAYALSSLYFSKLKISLSTQVFNVWQVFVGGLLLWPFSILFHQDKVIHWDLYLWGSLAWMVIALSFVANQLWLYLLKVDTVAAAGWLYLVPVLGYVYGYLLIHEHVSIWAIVGTSLVILGLLISKRNND